MPDDRHEQEMRQRYGRYIAGVDEAGRGPWAGPVVAAAVVFDIDSARIPHGLDDSKKLSARARDALFDEIGGAAHVGVGVSEVDEIDSINILQATMRAMVRAVAALPLTPDAALVDGNRCPPLACAAAPLVGGDARSLSIAAASIIAKVTRDRLMTRIAGDYPDYGFEQHKGYGTAKHRDALTRWGVTPHHRRSFKPVRAILEAAGERDRTS